MPEKETCRPAWRKSHFISNSNNIKRYKIYTFIYSYQRRKHADQRGENKFED